MPYGNDPIVGIDLGTSNSVVAVVGPDGLPRVIPTDEGHTIVPSVVAFHPNGSVLVGAEAKKRRVIDPNNTVYSVKRILGRRASSPEVQACAQRSSFVIKEGPNEQPVVQTRAGEFAPAEISAIVLDHLRGIAARALGTDVRRVVVTVPANFNDAQRQATAVAGEIAELVVVRVLNEPTAAALAYGHGQSLREIVAVYDFGGGTFDITILQLRDNVYEVLATAGDTFLGGDDIDNRLVEFSVDAFLRKERVDLRYDVTAMQRLLAAAEDVKCTLSYEARAVLRVDEIAVGQGGKHLDLAFQLTRDQFIPRIADIIDRSFPVCDEALRLAGLAPSQIDEVVLVGGTTRIPYLQDRVAAYFGRRPRTDLNPDEAVALGAALQGAALQAVLDRSAQKTMMMPAAEPAAGPPPMPEPEAETFVEPELELETVPRYEPPPASAPDARTLMPGALPPASPDSFTGAQKTAIARVAPKKVAVKREAQQFVEKNPFAAESDVRAPVLLDVTPRGLAVATVGGWCDEIIARNSQIPVEQTRVFTTGKDGQASVEVKICQGESRRFDENVILGSIVLDGLPPLPRGGLKIAVTFEINTDGILEASARDDQTGQQRSVRLELLGAQSSEEIAVARERLRGLR